MVFATIFLGFMLALFYICYKFPIICLFIAIGIVAYIICSHIKDRKKKEEFVKVANAYLEAFCKKHDFSYDPEDWIDSEGDVVNLGDYFVSFDDMRLDIDKDIDKEEYDKYYDYTMKVAVYGCTVPNYRSWLAGCPRLSDEQLEEIEKAHVKADIAKKELERIIKEEQEKIDYYNPSPF